MLMDRSLCLHVFGGELAKLGGMSVTFFRFEMMGHIQYLSVNGGDINFQQEITMQ